MPRWKLCASDTLPCSLVPTTPHAKDLAVILQLSVLPRYRDTGKRPLAVWSPPHRLGAKVRAAHNPPPDCATTDQHCRDKALHCEVAQPASTAHAACKARDYTQQLLHASAIEDWASVHWRPHAWWGCKAHALQLHLLAVATMHSYCIQRRCRGMRRSAMHGPSTHLRESTRCTMNNELNCS